MTQRVCAVIPGYNEEAHIADVVKRTMAQVPAVLVVDDGSRDATVERAEAAGATVLRHETNRGKGASLADGLDWAAAEGFDAAMTLDADGQHLPEEIPPFLASADRFDLIVGNRMQARKGMPLVRWITNRTMSTIVSRLAGVVIRDTQCGFRLMRTDAWRDLPVQSRNFDFESEVLVAAGRKGLRIGEVPVSTVYADEESKIRPVADTIRFLQMVWRLRRPSPSRKER